MFWGEMPSPCGRGVDRVDTWYLFGHKVDIWGKGIYVYLRCVDILSGELVCRERFSVIGWLKEMSYLPEGELGALIKALEQRAKKPKKGVVYEDKEFAKACPHLWELFSEKADSQGNVQEAASLVMFLEAEGWKVCLTHRGTGLQLWYSSPDFAGLFAGLEDRAGDPKAEWRLQGKRRGRPGGRE